MLNISLICCLGNAILLLVPDVSRTHIFNFSYQLVLFKKIPICLVPFTSKGLIIHAFLWQVNVYPILNLKMLKSIIKTQSPNGKEMQNAGQDTDNGSTT